MRKQVTVLEAQLMLRRQRVRALVSGANRKVAAKLTSPGMLVAAVGVGIAVEQVSRHRAWSLATVLEAGHVCTGVLLTLATFGLHTGENVRRPGP